MPRSVLGEVRMIEHNSRCKRLRVLFGVDIKLVPGSHCPRANQKDHLAMALYPCVRACGRLSATSKHGTRVPFEYGKTGCDGELETGLQQQH